MTRTYALKRLLEHGELSSKEIEEITCWTTKQVWYAITQLRKKKIVRKCPRMKWGLISLNPMPY
jgi:transcription initiation factor IIE alpha subunit